MSFSSFSRFTTYNELQDRLPEAHTLFTKLARQAFIGFVASVISDSVSNSLRVIKTYRQVNEERVDYCKSHSANCRTKPTRSLMNIFSGSCTSSSGSRWLYRSPWPWVEDTYFGEWPSRSHVFCLVENLLRSVRFFFAC